MSLMMIIGNTSRKRRLLLQITAVLLCVWMLPSAALCSGAEVEDVVLPEDAEPREFLLPIDFTPGPVPKAEGFSETKDENGKTVRIYEDSTIRAVVSETNWMKTDIWMADIVISDPSQLRTASTGNGADFSRTPADKVIRLAEHMNAVIALNGDSVGAKNEKHNFGVIFRQGRLIDARLDSSGKYRMDILLIDENGDFHGIHAAREGDLDDPSFYDGKKILNVFSFGPILVEDGELVADYQGVDREVGAGGTWMKMRTDEPSQRVVLCQVGPLHYKVISCAGHRSGNRGLSLPEFAEFVASQDVQFAYNMDGGDSSMLYFYRYGKVNLKNTGIRGLWDIVYFASAEQ